VASAVAGVQPDEPSAVDYGMVFRGTSAAAIGGSGSSCMPTVAPEFKGRGIWYERGGFAHARIERATSPQVSVALFANAVCA
jgi:hypothetical protein